MACDWWMQQLIGWIRRDKPKISSSKFALSPFFLLHREARSVLSAFSLRSSNGPDLLGRRVFSLSIGCIARVNRHFDFALIDMCSAFVEPVWRFNFIWFTGRQ